MPNRGQIPSTWDCRKAVDVQKTDSHVTKFIHMRVSPMAVSIRARGPPAYIRLANIGTREHAVRTRPPYLDPRRESVPIPAMPSAAIFQGNAFRPHPNSESLTRDSFPNPWLSRGLARSLLPLGLRRREANEVWSEVSRDNSRLRSRLSRTTFD